MLRNINDTENQVRNFSNALNIHCDLKSVERLVMKVAIFSKICDDSILLKCRNNFYDRKDDLTG